MVGVNKPEIDQVDKSQSNVRLVEKVRHPLEQRFSAQPRRSHSSQCSRYWAFEWFSEANAARASTAECDSESLNLLEVATCRVMRIVLIAEPMSFVKIDSIDWVSKPFPWAESQKSKESEIFSNFLFFVKRFAEFFKNFKNSPEKLHIHKTAIFPEPLRMT